MLSKGTALHSGQRRTLQAHLKVDTRQRSGPARPVTHDVIGQVERVLTSSRMQRRLEIRAEYPLQGFSRQEPSFGRFCESTQFTALVEWRFLLTI